MFKTYHISLDSEGTSIVSQTVWEMVQRIPAHGFSMINEVEKPPTQRIAVGFAGSARIVQNDGKEIVSGSQ